PKLVFELTTSEVPSHCAVLLTGLPIMVEVDSAPSVVTVESIFMSPMGPPCCSLTIAMELPLSVMVMVPVLGPPICPKLLLAASSFHAPLKFGCEPAV